MTIEKITCNNTDIAVVKSQDIIISDIQSALDLIMTVRYDTGTERVAISKSAIAEDFFRLSSGLAGEILEKFITYRMKLAIFGDYSIYTSKPLHDFIYESNCGKNIFFAASQEEAIDRLTAV